MEHDTDNDNNKYVDNDNNDVAADNDYNEDDDDDDNSDDVDHGCTIYKSLRHQLNSHTNLAAYAKYICIELTKVTLTVQQVSTGVKS